MTTRVSSTLWILFVILTFALGTAVLCPASAAEQTDKKDTRPDRGLSVAFEYPGVVINEGDDASVDLIVKNKGKQDESILFTITQSPKGWDTRIKTYSFGISGVYVPEDDDKRVQFNAKPEKDTKPGTYTFKVSAQSADGSLTASPTLTITLTEKEAEKGEIELTTSYPVLRGPNDAKFEFSLDVKNKIDKEALFNLTATVPKNWQANFKPPYEDKYISSLRLKDDESKSLNVEVTPDRFATAGEYRIPVTIGAGEAKAEAELKVIITGTYTIETGTASGLLSLTTEKGSPGSMSVYIKNTGSAPASNIEFLSIKPENWKVEFDPETIPTIEPGDLKQVEVSITPAAEALVGDYAVGVNIKGEKSSDDLEFRVTVKASAAWGWIGIGIIILVILGLFALFVTFGRR
ncbi:MAG: hypothetical protein JSV40_09780 [Deltaproteobacteria bacterium]|nr:MAG: hypothetical protein JSV40_09780 [Deltaproteobacteria bacterium]